jgi:chromosome segregation ATPase
MTDEPRDDLEPRVSALESQMAEVRADAAAARILASGADRDVSEVRAELRAHLQAINALGEVQRETRTELRRTRTELKAEIDELRTEMRTGFAETRAGFATMAAGMQHIVDLLDRPAD